MHHLGGDGREWSNKLNPTLAGGKSIAVLNKSRASLRISADDLEPTEITALLGREPTKSWRKGELRRPGSTVPARFGMWSLEATERQPGDLDSQIKEIFSALADDPETWSKLHERFKIDLFCGLFMKEWNEGEGISAEALRLLSTRAIPIGLDIYGPDDAENGHVCPIG